MFWNLNKEIIPILRREKINYERAWMIIHHIYHGLTRTTANLLLFTMRARLSIDGINLIFLIQVLGDNALQKL